MFEEKKENHISYDIFKNGVNLPSFHELKKIDIERIVVIIVDMINLKKGFK